MVPDVFLVLADPTRRRLLEMLRSGPLAVGDLVAAVDVTQPTVSRHLSVLREAGFVEMRPEAQKRVYSLRTARFRELEAWGRSYREHLEGRLDRLGDLVERKTPKKRTRG